MEGREGEGKVERKEKVHASKACGVEREKERKCRSMGLAKPNNNAVSIENGE